MMSPEWQAGYAQGYAEALGLVPPDHPVKVRHIVSHHGSDCSLDHTPDKISGGYCRGIVLVRRDDFGTETTDYFLFGDYPEKTAPFVLKPWSHCDLKSPVKYGWAFWNYVEIPPIKKKEE